MEKDIRNFDLSKVQANSPLSSDLTGKKSLSGAQMLVKRARSWNYPVILSHILLFLAVITVLTIGYNPGGRAPQVVNNVATSTDRVPTVDEVASVNVAATVANSADYLVANNVTELANTVEAKNSLAQSTDADYLSKPQFVDEGQRIGVTKYTTKEGDTTESVANQFGLTVQTVQWANGLSSNEAAVGQELLIPAVDGVVYTVKEGDTAESVAQRYQADVDQVIAFNDAELGGLQPGQIIVLPNGQLPEGERPGADTGTDTTSSSLASGSGDAGFAFGSGPVFGGNGYAYGYCTWHVANRRAAIGRTIPNNWGNATTWDEGARAMGMRVDQIPEVGAILQLDGGWMGYGHVAIVEQVNPDGSFVISEMNYAGWNVVSSRSFSPGDAANYDFIH